MKYNKKLIYWLFGIALTFSVTFITSSSTVYALDYVACGDATGIPKPIPMFTTIVYTLLIVGVPLALIISSIITLIKAITSGNADNVVKAKNKLLKKIIIAAVVYLTAGLVKFIIGKVSSTEQDKSTVGDCLNCFLYYNGCTESESGNHTEQGTYTSDYTDVSTYTGLKVGEALTEEEFLKELNKLDKAPTYEELVELADKLYKMPESVFKMVFGWAANEGYDSERNNAGKIDYYLAYLSDSIGINFYMGTNDAKTADAMAAKIGGAAASQYAVWLPRAAEEAINNPKGNAITYKIMYIVLLHPDEKAHDCDGLSNYTPYGGKVYYDAGYYGKYPIKVWTLDYEVDVHWKEKLR